MLCMKGQDTHGAWNPLDPKNQGNTEVWCKILNNTVEQYSTFFVSLCHHVIKKLSTYLDPNYMKIIPMLVMFFVLGRLLFQLGYVIVNIAQN